MQQEGGDPLEKFPTSFDLVDIEKVKQYHNFQMRYDYELIRWNDYDSLFVSQPSLVQDHVSDQHQPDSLSSDTDFSDIDINDFLNPDENQNRKRMN